MNFNIIIILILLFIVICNIFLCIQFNPNLENMDTEKDNDKVKYDSNNYNIKYHDDESKLEKEQGFGLDPQEIVVYDPEKKEMVSLYVPKNQTSPLYNEPGHYKYSADNYVPSYTEKTLLTTNEIQTYNKLFR